MIDLLIYWLIEQRVRVSFEAGGGQDDNNMVQDNADSPHLTPSLQDSEEEKATTGDGPGQANIAAEDSTAEANDKEAGDVCPKDAMAASEPTGTETNSEEEEDFRHGHRKYLLYSSDAADGLDNEETNRSKVEPKRSANAEDASNGDEHLKQWVAKKHTDEPNADSDDGRVKENDKVLIDCTDHPDGETTETENMPDESGVGENDNRRTAEAVENNEKLIQNERTQKLPPENTSEETGESLQPSPEESAAGETCMPETEPEGNVSTTPREIQTKDAESVERRATNVEPVPLPDHAENKQTEELRFLAHGETGERRDTTSVLGETTADSADARDRSSVENEADKNTNPTAEPAVKQTSQSQQTLGTSTGHDESHVADSVQPSETRRETQESVQQDESASIQQTNCKQSDQEHLACSGETAKEQSDKDNSHDNSETEQRVEATKTVEQNELEVAEMEDKAVTLSPDGEGQKSEDKNAQVRDHITNTVDNDIVERPTADGADTKENSERTSDKLAEEWNKSVEATKTNRSVDEVQINDAAKTGAQQDKNAPDDSYDEPDKVVRKSTERPHATSETIHAIPPAGADKVNSQHDNSYKTHKERKDDSEDAQEEGQASGINETCETTPPENAEMQTENVTNEAGIEKCSGAHDPADALTEEQPVTSSGEIVDNTESEKSAVENNREQTKQLQSEQTEVPATTTTEAESQPTVSTDADELNEVAIDKLASDILSEEQFSAADGGQSHDNSPVTDEVKNRPESANAMDKSSADVSNKMCETVKNAATENGKTTETVEDQPAETPAAESAELSVSSSIERTEKKPETEVVENDTSHSHHDATSESRERNDEDASDAENADEVEFVRIADSEDEPDDVPSPASIEDKASDAADDPFDRNNSAEVKGENSTAKTEMKTERPTEAEAYESLKQQFNENPAYDRRNIQSTEVSGTADSIGVTEAEKNEAPETNCTEEQSTKTADGNKHSTHDGASNGSAASNTDTATLQAETTAKPAEVDRTGESNENVTPASDEVFEATAETDKAMSQNDGSAEEIPQRQQTDNDQYPDADGLENLSDSAAENEESIRRYVDGCRDIELSGVKLSANQVGLAQRNFILIAFC